jgi:hypothetical protein
VKRILQALVLVLLAACGSGDRITGPVATKVVVDTTTHRDSIIGRDSTIAGPYHYLP